MKTKQLGRLVVVVAILGGVAGVRAAPLDNRFTYQGQLKRDGAPLDGLTDFEFSLWTLSAAGVQIGATQTKLNVSVENGLFKVELDFGASAFQGDERWLQVTVRNPPGIGVYVPLTQRQRITASPYSLFSLNSYWRASGSAITNTNTGFVGINRSTTVSSAEVFGIQAEVAGTSYGGMYIRTDSTTAKPFYGYTTGTETAWTYLDGATGNWHVYNDGNRITVEDGGNVGIGEVDPGRLLDVGGRMRVREGGGSAGIWLYQTTPAADRAFVGMYDDDTVGLYGNTGAGWTLLMDTTSGNVGIDTTAPEAKLHVANGTDSEPTGGGYLVVGSTSGLNISIDNNEIMARNNGATATLFLNNDGGTVRVPVLEITGADLAEKFPVSEQIEPGMVAEIDPQHPGQLRLARGAYSRRVAGVVSGANGLATGAILGNLPGQDDAPAIALSGRVWVHCDASNGPIVPGDLLTTSDTPGHAMTVSDFAKGQGAILGKAMTGLNKGETGLVLTLISLQ